jgi:hypothetical protein
MTKTRHLVWVATVDGRLWRVDTETEEPVAMDIGGEPVALRADGGFVFVALADGRILSVDPTAVA